MMDSRLIFRPIHIFRRVTQLSSPEGLLDFLRGDLSPYSGMNRLPGKTPRANDMDPVLKTDTGGLVQIHQGERVNPR